MVTVGVLSLLRMVEGPLGLLRMLRAFRVFRLFKRIKSLNKIIVSLARAVPGVAQAFLIMVIFMSIYAILAVEFFAEHGMPKMCYDEATPEEIARRPACLTNISGQSTDRWDTPWYEPAAANYIQNGPAPGMAAFGDGEAYPERRRAEEQMGTDGGTTHEVHRRLASLENTIGGYNRWEGHYYTTTYNPYFPRDMSQNATIRVPTITARGIPYGYEYFGSFSKAFYTMWQILTGESWSEAVVRPLMFGYTDGGVLSAALVGCVAQRLRARGALQTPPRLPFTHPPPTPPCWPTPP